MVVDAEVNKEQGRPLFGVDGGVCSKKYLTGPTLLEMYGNFTYQEFRRDAFLTVDPQHSSNQVTYRFKPLYKGRQQ